MPPAPPPSPGPADSGRVRILVVDDHATFVRHVSRFLNAQERLHVVGTASTARQGLEEATRLRPDVVLLDISLPGESGLDVLPDLRALEAPPHVIVVSTQDPAYADRALAGGAAAFVHKNELADALVATIDRVVRSGAADRSSGP